MLKWPEEQIFYITLTSRRYLPRLHLEPHNDNVFKFYLFFLNFGSNFVILIYFKEFVCLNTYVICLLDF